MVAVAQKIRKEQTQRSQYISWEDFEKEYLTREDEFKYEWLNGTVEKTLKTMNEKQLYIVDNITELFLKLKFENKINGLLVSEPDVFFAGHHRKPDIAYFTKEQIQDSRKGKKSTPQFVVEIISKNDQINKVTHKMEDYYAAEVPVIWHIFPNFKVVHVYKGNQMTVCRDKDICSAEEVIKGFSMSVNDIFA